METIWLGERSEQIREAKNKKLPIQFSIYISMLQQNCLQSKTCPNCPWKIWFLKDINQKKKKKSEDTMDKTRSTIHNCDANEFHINIRDK